MTPARPRNGRAHGFDVGPMLLINSTLFDPGLEDGNLLRLQLVMRFGAGASFRRDPYWRCADKPRFARGDQGIRTAFTIIARLKGKGAAIQAKIRFARPGIGSVAEVAIGRQDRLDLVIEGDFCGPPGNWARNVRKIRAFAERNESGSRFKTRRSPAKSSRLERAQINDRRKNSHGLAGEIEVVCTAGGSRCAQVRRAGQVKSSAAVRRARRPTRSMRLH